MLLGAALVFGGSVRRGSYGEDAASEDCEGHQSTHFRLQARVIRVLERKELQFSVVSRHNNTVNVRLLSVLSQACREAAIEAGQRVRPRRRGWRNDDQPAAGVFRLTILSARSTRPIPSMMMPRIVSHPVTVAIPCARASPPSKVNTRPTIFFFRSVIASYPSWLLTFGDRPWQSGRC